ncbi:hypothetical protein ACFWAE_14420 [Priestia megaterium]|uniref:hypothetical protein n=1 Tax=Priestia megaterium TaxID=1404 RepID=UPI00367061E4
MNDKEILIHLIRHTGFVEAPFYLANKPELAKSLQEAGYTYDDDGFQRFTEKGEKLLNDFYFGNKERTITTLKRLKNLHGNSPYEYKLLCNELNFEDDSRAHYLLVRLEQEQIISVRWKTDEDTIKVTFR